MAIDPYPSKRNDPEWADFTKAHGATPVAEFPAAVAPSHRPATHVAPPTVPLTGIPLDPSLYLGAVMPERRRGPLAQRCMDWLLSRTGIQTVASSLGIPSLVWAVGEMFASQYPVGTGLAGAALTLGGGALGIGSVVKTFGNGPALAGVGIAVAGLQLSMTAAPGLLMGFGGWLIGSAGCATARVAYANSREMPKAKADLVKAKIVTEHWKGAEKMVKAQHAHFRYVQEVQAAAPVQEPSFLPGMQGRVQRAVWLATGLVVPVARVDETDNGWVAEILLGVLTLRMLSVKADVIAETLGLDDALKVEYGASRDYAVVTYREKGELPQVVGYTPVRTDLPWDAPVKLGVDGYGDVIEQKVTIHMIVAGSTGGGKSNAINLVCLQLASRHHVELIGVDLKPGTPEMRPLMPILSGLANSLHSAHKVLDDAIREMNRRGDVLAQTGTKKWDPERHGGPVRFIVMDEYAELIRAEAVYLKGLEPADKREWVSVKDKVETLAALSRFVGIFLIMGTQTPDGTLFGDNTAARTNFPIRIVFRLMEDIHYRFALPASGGWDKIISDKSPGRFTVYSPKYDEPGMYASYRVADDPDDALLGLDPEQLVNEVERIADKRFRWGYTGCSPVEQPVRLAKAPEESPTDRIRAYAAGNPGLSQSMIADDLGVSQSTVSRALKGA